MQQQSGKDSMISGLFWQPKSKYGGGNTTFSHQLLTAFSVGIVVFAMAASWLISWVDSTHRYEQQTLQGIQLAELFALQVNESVIKNNASLAAPAATAVIKFPSIDFVQTFDRQGKPLFRLGYPGDNAIDSKRFINTTKTRLYETPNAWHYIAPIMSKTAGTWLGIVHLSKRKSGFYIGTRRLFMTNFLISLAFAFVMSLVLRAVTKRLTLPLHRLSQIMEQNTGASIPDGRADITGPADVEKMARAFNQLMDALRERDKRLLEQNESLENRVTQRTKDLEIMRDKALDAAQAKSKFLANMSHELRTPLNAIIGYSDMLLEDLQDQTIKTDIVKIYEAGIHLLSLINSILDFSKLEAGKMEVFTEQAEITAIIEQVQNIIEPLCQKNHNRLEIEIPDNIGMVMTDVTKLHQVLYNLLSNAGKFTHHGCVSLTLERQPVNGEPWLFFRVTDTGIGIDPDQMPKLFREFSQADNSTTRQFGGTGLGLAISRQYTELLGGYIGVERIKGKGSTFTLAIAQYHTADRMEHASARCQTAATTA